MCDFVSTCFVLACPKVMSEFIASGPFECRQCPEVNGQPMAPTQALLMLTSPKLAFLKTFTLKIATASLQPPAHAPPSQQDKSRCLPCLVDEPCLSVSLWPCSVRSQPHHPIIDLFCTSCILVKSARHKENSFLVDEAFSLFLQQPEGLR